MAGCISVIVGLLILLTQSPSLGAEQAVQQVVVYSSLDAIRTQRVLALFRKGERYSSTSTKYLSLIGGRALTATYRENEPIGGCLVWCEG